MNPIPRITLSSGLERFSPSICGSTNVWVCFLKELKFCESMGHQDQAGISGLDLKEKSNFNHNVRIVSFGQVIEC